MTASSEPVADEQRSPVRAPDFFIVGHAKSGTTALYEMLRPHPQIFMPDAKEPWFFSTDMRPRFQPRLAGAGPQTLEEYLSLFAGAAPEQRAGEASSSYLWSRTAAAYIAEVQPEAKIIAILREPASFLRSLHLQLLQSHVESQKDFRKAMALQEDRRNGRHIPRNSHRPQLLQYSNLVRYVEQLRRYEELFAPEQMLVLIYDDFRSDNAGTLRSVLRFLEVDENRPLEVLDVNHSTLMRSQQLDGLVHAVTVGRGPVAGAAKAAIKALSPQSARQALVRFARLKVVHGAPPPPDESFMRELRRRFEGEVVALSEHLGRDLVSLWGYDNLE